MTTTTGWVKQPSPAVGLDHNHSPKGAFRVILEKNMEDAIIENPGQYIEEGLTLIARQYRIGKYIFDLLFEDRHGAKLIVELQKGTLDRNHTYKILDYFDEYKEKNPDEFVELMVIANKIPRERRERLSSFGISFKEIPATEFPQKAEGHIQPPPNNNMKVRDESSYYQKPEDLLPLFWGQPLSQQIVPTSCNIRTVLERLLAQRQGIRSLETWETVNITALGANQWSSQLISAILKNPGSLESQEVLQQFKARFEQTKSQNSVPKCIRNAFLLGCVSRSAHDGGRRKNFIDWASTHGYGGTKHASGAIYQVGKTAGQTFGLISDKISPTDLFFQYFEV